MVNPFKNPFDKRKEIISNGKLTGYDTGTQSVIATPTEKKIYNLFSGGGGSSDKQQSIVSQEELQKRQQELSTQAKLKQLTQDLAIKKQQQQVAQEQARIKALQQKLARENAQKRIQNLKDVSTGAKLQREILINNRTKERIVTTKNLDTGETSTRTFNRGGQTGWISGYDNKILESQEQKRIDKLVSEQQEKVGEPEIKKRWYNKINNYLNSKLVKSENSKTQLKYNDLTKQRDKIYEDINKLSSKYSGTLTEEQYKEYEKELIPLLAQYKNYSQTKDIVLKKYPDKKIAATLEYDPSIGQNVLTTSVKDQSLTNQINRAVEKATQSIQRGGGLKDTAVLSGLVAAQTGASAVKGFTQLPSAIKDVIKNPKLLTKIPSAVAKSGKEFGMLFKISPTAAFVKIGTEIYVIKGTNKVLSKLGKLSSKTFVRLNPKFLGKIKTGQKLTIKTGSGKSVKLNVVGKIPKQAIKTQVKTAGKEINAISSQGDKLLGFLRRSRVIQKPLGKTKTGKLIEKSLGKKASNLLKRYDAGSKLTRNQITYLNKQIRKAGSKGLLERSFFADPTGKIRPSRLGITKEKKLKFLDYISEDITFRKPKPQILLFEKLKVQAFPKSLKNVVKKLKSGKSLTQKEATKLLEFQLKKSGKAKPLGFTTAEAEVTIPAGEIIKKGKKVGIIQVKGKNVPIIQASIYKPTKLVKNLIKKYKTGKITKKQIKSLDKKLKKATGFDYKLSSSRKVSGRYVPIKRIGLSVGISRVRKNKKFTYKKLTPSTKKIKKSYSGKSIKYTSSGKPYVITSSGARFISSPRKIPISRITPRKYIPKRYSPYSPPKITKTPIKPIKVISKRKKKEPKILKKQSKPILTFNVYGKSGRKFVKLNTKPLRKIDALSKGAYAIDNTTSKQFKIVPAGKKKEIGKLRFNERNYFNRAGYKLREYRIKKGRKFVINPKYIEKTKYGIDTRGEKKGLTIARYLKQRTGVRRSVKSHSPPLRKRIHKVRRTIVRRRITPTQRRILLSNLRKARAVRMRNLRRR